MSNSIFGEKCQQKHLRTTDNYDFGLPGFESLSFFVSDFWIHRNRMARPAATHSRIRNKVEQPFFFFASLLILMANRTKTDYLMHSRISIVIYQLQVVFRLNLVGVRSRFRSFLLPLFAVLYTVRDTWLHAGNFSRFLHLFLIFSLASENIQYHKFGLFILPCF